MHTKTIRLIQIFVLFCLALYATFIALGNLMDYDSNYQFVRHVLAMDTTFPNNGLMWRSITNETLVHMAYWGIILTEIAVAVIGWVGVIKLSRRFRDTSDRFNDAKSIGLYSFAFAIALWFIGFLCFGSEWFAMWQSSAWNGKQTAMDIVQIVGVFLVVYMIPVHILTKRETDDDKK